MPNIVKEYNWTTVKGAYLDEAPRIRAITYEVDNNEIFNTVVSWAKAAQTFRGSYKDFYDGLHSTTRKDEWVFPYFGDDVRQFSNDWADQLVTSTTGSRVAGGDLAAGVKQDAESLLTTKGILEGAYRSLWSEGESKAAGSLFEPPKFYQYSANDNAFTLEFTLLNTESSEDVDNNYELIKKLIKENRFTRVGGLATKPPFLWQVFVPGYRQIRWASCDVGVNLLGRRALLNGRITPEGYRVSLSFKSLYTEPSNYMDDVIIN